MEAMVGKPLVWVPPFNLMAMLGKAFVFTGYPLVVRPLSQVISK